VDELETHKILRGQMTDDVQQERDRLVHKFENPDFSEDENVLIAKQLDETLGLAEIAVLLWMRLPVDSAFSSQPLMFMVKPPGDSLSIKQQEHVQWTWNQHHFMLFLAPLNEPETAMLTLWVDEKLPVLEIHVKHEPDDKGPLKEPQIHAIKPGTWIDDFLSYYGAYCRLRIISEATREKYRTEMEGFWRLAGI
jgi:hypothetical protein